MVVTDGFTGNTALKTAEGTATLVMHLSAHRAAPQRPLAAGRAAGEWRAENPAPQARSARGQWRHLSGD